MPAEPASVPLRSTRPKTIEELADPENVADTSDSVIDVGTIYEDCGYHPVLCTYKNDVEDEMRGISLIDGQIRSCSVVHCGPERLTLGQALVIKRDLAVYIAHRTAGGDLPSA